MNDDDKEAVLEQLQAKAVAMDADVDELGIIKKSEYQETQDEIEELRAENEQVQEENEELQGKVDHIKGIYAEELSEVRGFDAETLSEKFELEELEAEFEDEFGSVEALTEGAPDPKGEDKPEEEELSSENQERIEELQEKREVYAEMGWETNVEAVEEELAELQGE